VRSLHGVKAVVNEIELRPSVNAFGVKAKIENALKRDAQIDSNSITVESTGSEVILRGQVHSWRERRDAEHAAFGAPGVASVENLITVGF
jgi:osmotically-inducible protein OsmY